MCKQKLGLCINCVVFVSLSRTERKKWAYVPRNEIDKEGEMNRECKFYQSDVKLYKNVQCRAEKKWLHNCIYGIPVNSR